ncbi:MAG: hypothetical protein SGPRY_009072 [Prymnesium sp.]
MLDVNGNPIRFKAGERVEVRLSPGSKPSEGIDMISTLTCAGGPWVKAEVAMVAYRQDDWCPDFYCAYAVKVEGDSVDGLPCLSAVREDDDRCIRPLPSPRIPPGESRSSTMPFSDLFALLTEMGRVSEAEFDAITDQIARGDKEEAELVREWYPFCLEVGTEVWLCALEGRADLNGKRGKIVSFQQESKRFGVRLSTGNLLAARPKNSALSILQLHAFMAATLVLTSHLYCFPSPPRPGLPCLLSIPPPPARPPPIAPLTPSHSIRCNAFLASFLRACLPFDLLPFASLSLSPSTPFPSACISPSLPTRQVTTSAASEVSEALRLVSLAVGEDAASHICNFLKCTRCGQPCKPGTRCRVPHPAHLCQEIGGMLGPEGMQNSYGCRGCWSRYTVFSPLDEEEGDPVIEGPAYCFEGEHTIQPLPDDDHRRVLSDAVSLVESPNLQAEIDAIPSDTRTLTITSRGVYDDTRSFVLAKALPALEMLQLVDVSWSTITLTPELTPNITSLRLQSVPEDCDLEIDLPKLQVVTIHFWHGVETPIYRMLDVATELEAFDSYKLWVDSLAFASNKLHTIDLHRSDSLRSLSMWAPNLRHLGLQACYGLDRLHFLKTHPLAALLPADHVTPTLEVNTVNASLSASATRALNAHPKVKQATSSHSGMPTESIFANMGMMDGMMAGFMADVFGGDEEDDEEDDEDDEDDYEDEDEDDKDDKDDKDEDEEEEEEEETAATYVL